jgi:hypothetical protein
MIEQNNFSCKKKQNSYGSGLNASSSDFSWLDRTTSVYNVISCVDVCLLRVSEDLEWLKLKEQSVSVCAVNVNLFDGNVHENITERKNAGHVRHYCVSLTADKCKESYVHISVSSRECVV